MIKATGQQWLWRYDYPNGSFSYYKLVIPVDTAIELKLESTDVIHTWSVPDLAPKVDAVPGKVTHVFFRADAEGEFSGQSSTLSGQAYAPMRTDGRSRLAGTLRRIHQGTAEGHQSRERSGEKIEAENERRSAANPEAEEGEEPAPKIEEAEEPALAKKAKPKPKNRRRMKAAKKPSGGAPTPKPAKKSSPKTARSATAPRPRRRRRS